MYFSFTEEQKLLQQSVTRFLDNEYSFDARCNASQSEQGMSEKIWRKFAELGWLSLNIPENSGGLGAGAVENAIVTEGLGHALAIEPYISTTAVSVGILERCSVLCAQELLPLIAEGKARVALATMEPQARFNLEDIETSAEKTGDRYRIRGKKCVVLDAPSAQHLIVTARVSGATRDPQGIALFLLDNPSAGVNLHSYPTIDGKRAADITFDITVGPERLLSTAETGYLRLEYGVDAGTVALCAEAVGIMKYLHDTTLEYLKTRKQFGQPLASFQALQHRMVDMFVAYELSRSMAYMAAARLNDTREERRRAVSAAKVHIGNAGRSIGEEAIQLHGGMGMTDELPLGHYFKRLTLIDRTFGDVDHHLTVLAKNI